MYCPNCGKENPERPRFCRSCGLGLLTISQALGNELSAPKSDGSTIEIVEPVQKRWHSPLMYGFLMLLLGMVIVFFGKRTAVEQFADRMRAGMGNFPGEGDTDPWDGYQPGDDPLVTRVPLQSYGFSARANLLNFLILRLDYARPIGRPGINGLWTISLGPTF